MTEKFKHGSDVHQHELKRGACFQCRYTLQYTYPYAYYLEKGARKNWFESQQAQLEAEVENLSWKVERAEITDRGVSFSRSICFFLSLSLSVFAQRVKQCGVLSV